MRGAAGRRAAAEVAGGGEEGKGAAACGGIERFLNESWGDTSFSAGLTPKLLRHVDSWRKRREYLILTGKMPVAHGLRLPKLGDWSSQPLRFGLEQLGAKGFGL
jgi:hypothetical protein